MKASPGARSWIAAGVRHELLTRALPALRHDMAAPISVIRMGLLMLKRQVAAPGIDPAACNQRVDLIDNQIGELIVGIRSLRHWELATADDGITRSALVAECVALMRAAFGMQGIELEIDATLAPVEGETVWPQGAALRYLLLGAMGHLHDSVDQIGAIAFAAEGPDGLRLSALPRAVAASKDHATDVHRAPRALAIDTVALQSLADDLGYAVTPEGDVLRLLLGAA
ncbi:MAG: hypothetical protein EOP76_08875 [Variovorax sp.]|nr:MAG: hypothetical protein EOP76_08875 [Variovorax sp.]